MSLHFEGRLTDEGHELVQRVYYEDTDFSGAVYHARYLHFMERARTEFIRCKGFIQSEKLGQTDPENSAGFVVTHIDIKYITPARMDDVLTILTIPLQVKGARMKLSQNIYRQDQDCLIQSVVTVACVNGNGRPRRLPESLL